MSIDALAAIQSLLPDAELVQSEGSADESYSGAYSEPPRIVSATLMEGRRFRSHRIEGEPEVRFSGFLDGIQRAKILCHRRGVPIIDGTVAAAVRIRVDRHYVTWGGCTPIVSRSLYMPLALLGCEGRSEVAGFAIADTSRSTGSSELVSRHPAALRAVALERVGYDRENIERSLAEAWCAAEATPLCVDGGIGGSARVAASHCAIGVVKSHHTLFADGDALEIVMSLERGERSSVFVPPSRKRAEVASWYLRVRDPRHHDAMFGLVRVEVAVCADIAERANEVSRWVLAESSPLALPDGRWDRMAYGIRNCEQFLRSIA